MPMTITPKQCKKARSLLKWNIHDVVGKCNLSPVRLERFERASIRLSRPENDELYKLFTKFGLVFTLDFEVILAEKVEDHEGKIDLNDEKRKEAEKELEDALEYQRKKDEEDARKGDHDKQKEKDKLWVHTPEYSGPDRRTPENQRFYSGDERRADRKDLVKKVIEKYHK